MRIEGSCFFRRSSILYPDGGWDQPATLVRYMNSRESGRAKLDASFKLQATSFKIKRGTGYREQGTGYFATHCCYAVPCTLKLEPCTPLGAAVIPRSARILLPRRNEQVAIHFGERSDAEHGHVAADLVPEQGGGVVDAGRAGDRGSVEEGPADEDVVRAEREGLQHVGSAADAAVHHDGHVAGLGHRAGEGAQRRDAVVELAAAVVRHEDAIHAALARNAHVLRREHSFQDELALPRFAHEPDVLPGEPVAGEPRPLEVAHHR